MLLYTNIILLYNIRLYLKYEKMYKNRLILGLPSACSAVVIPQITDGRMNINCPILILLGFIYVICWL